MFAVRFMSGTNIFAPLRHCQQSKKPGASSQPPVLAVSRMSKAEQEKTDKMLIKSLEREERERKRVSPHLITLPSDPALKSTRSPYSYA